MTDAQSRVYHTFHPKSAGKASSSMATQRRTNGLEHGAFEISSLFYDWILLVKSKGSHSFSSNSAMLIILYSMTKRSIEHQNHCQCAKQHISVLQNLPQLESLRLSSRAKQPAVRTHCGTRAALCSRHNSFRMAQRLWKGGIFTPHFLTVISNAMLPYTSQ